MENCKKNEKLKICQLSNNLLNKKSIFKTWKIELKFLHQGI